MSKTILIVDHDDLVREILHIRLSQAGYRCHAAPHGEAALSYLNASPADLVVMEAMMPMLSGAETLVRIRGNPSLSHVPVLMLSQKAAPSERQMVMALGAAGFMAKPFCSEELLSLIARLLEARPASPIRRLKVTVMGAAALTAALPAAVQAAGPQPPVAPAPLLRPETASLLGAMTVSKAAASSAEPPVISPAGDLQPAPVLAAPAIGNNAERWQTRHSLALVLGRSSISDSASPDWNDATLAYSVRPNKRSGYAFEVNRATRFGLTDYQLSARGDWQVGPRTSVYAAVVAAPSTEFREKRGVRAGFSHTLMPHLEAGSNVRIGTFADGNKLAVTPYIAVSSKGERYTLIAELINLWDLDGPADYRTGYGLRLRGQPSDRLRVLAGFARYPEVELGITRNVRSIYGGASYDVSDSVGVSASYANDRYEGFFTRHGLTAGLTYRWRGPG